MRSFGMQDDLFRAAVVKSRASRLHGDVMLYPSASARLATIVIVLIVSAATAWVALAHYARIEPARGIMVPVDGASKIYGLHPGIVSRFMVKEGDLVTAGQQLAVVKLEAPNSHGAFGTTEALDSLRAQRSLAREQLGLSRRRSETELAKLEDAIRGLRSMEVTLRDQIALQREVVESTALTFDQLADVVAKGFVSKLEFERRRQASLAAKQDLSRLEQQLASARSDIARTLHEQSSARLDELTQQASGKSAIEGLRQQRSRVEGEGSYVVEAPISGRVTAVQTSVGQTVGGPVPMMVVMPAGVALRADIYVPSRAIGFVRRGQEVRLLYDAFPYQRFGSFRARIDTVSRVAVAGTETNAPFKLDEPVYRVTVSPLSQEIDAYGKQVALQPGMTLTANIVLERQTFLDWVLSPLHAVVNRS